MNKYEFLYCIDNELNDEAKEVIINKLNAIITDNGGNIESTDKWGARKLAYPINFKNEGYYILMYFNAKPELIAELDRVIGITDGILRHMFVKKEA